MTTASARRSPAKKRDASLFLPRVRTLPSLRKASRSCRGCDLYRNATQTVFGEGASHAAILVVGEQPGDQEDQEGHPFVGPAGRLLDKLLDEVGIDRRTLYLTNAVKHFKWKPRGKRRMHDKPNFQELRACHAWLDEELRVVDPKVVVCLGASAAQSFFGSAFRITAAFGQVMRGYEDRSFLVTFHPSAILRMPDRAKRTEARDELKRALLLAKSVAERAQIDGGAGK